MANVNDRTALPELACDREIAPHIYYDAYTDTLIVSLYGPPEAGMNVPVDDTGIDLRVSLDVRELPGFEIPDSPTVSCRAIRSIWTSQPAPAFRVTNFNTSAPGSPPQSVNGAPSTHFSTSSPRSLSAPERGE